MKPIGLVIGVAVLMLTSFPSTATADHEGKFQSFGTARKAQDPAGPHNHVISVDTSATDFGGVVRPLNVKVHQLDGYLAVNYFFVAPKSCNLGSPRIQLAIDTDGDGVRNGNAFGYIGPFPNFTGCVQGSWQVENLTDRQLRWDLTQFGGAFYNTWEEVETFFAALPAHVVLRGSLVEDPGASSGRTFYDNVVIGNRMLRDASDSTGD